MYSTQYFHGRCRKAGQSISATTHQYIPCAKLSSKSIHEHCTNNEEQYLEARVCRFDDRIVIEHGEFPTSCTGSSTAIT